MAQLNFHPAIGFGDLMPGWHVVPQNPLMTGGTPLVPSIQATAPGRVMRRGKLAELMPGGFTVPQNPLRAALGGMGCGCGGGCSGMKGMGWTPGVDPGYGPTDNDPVQDQGLPYGVQDYGWGPMSGSFYARNLSGMGSLDTSSVSGFMDSVTGWLTEPSSIFPGVANWVLFGGAIIAADLYFGKRRR